MHELAEHYELHSQAYDAEPKRYISIVKLAKATIPLVLLSEVIRKGSKTNK